MQQYNTPIASTSEYRNRQTVVIYNLEYSRQSQHQSESRLQMHVSEVQQQQIQIVNITVQIERQQELQSHGKVKK